MDRRIGVLHPAADRYIANGLQPDGKDRLFVAAVTATAPDRIGDDLPPTCSIAKRLRHPESGEFYILVQLRSTPEAPISLVPAASSSFEWRTRSTLRAHVEVKPWGSLDRISVEDEREHFLSADELIYTTVWTLVPEVEEVPNEVELILRSRGQG